MQMKYYVLTFTLLGLIGLTIAIAAARSSSAQPSLHPDYQLLVKSLRGDETAVRDLLRSGADPNTPPGENDKGMTAIIFAAMENHTNIVRMLAQAGADVNAKSDTGTTALMFAALNGNDQSIRTLLQKGANPSAQEQAEGMTALMYALQRGQVSSARILAKEAAASMNTVRARNGDTALLAAVRTGNLQIVDALLESKPDLEVRDQFNQTPLMNAAREGHTRIVVHLLNKGANVNAADSKGKTALFKALVGNHRGTVQVLKARGAR